MHKSDCLASWEEWHTRHPEEAYWTHIDRGLNTDITVVVDWNQVTPSALNNMGCCDACEMKGGKRVPPFDCQSTNQN